MNIQDAINYYEYGIKCDIFKEPVKSYAQMAVDALKSQTKRNDNMKSVLISIQPKWCELIALGRKTVEVRKTRPKIETPFKCYIYCTSSNVHECLLQNESGAKIIHAINYKTAIPVGGYVGNGKVIGEFVCDEVIEFYEETLVHDELDGSPTEGWMNWKISDKLCEKMDLYTIEDVERCSCLKRAEFISYLHPNMHGYGWHISDLVIYDKPKELSEFYMYCGDNPKCDGCEARYYSYTEYGIDDYCCSIIEGCRPLKRPPQSWCYVEGVDEK